MNGELERLRALSEAATPGKWTERINHKPYRIVVFGGQTAWRAGRTTSDIEPADARLIVAAVNYVRDLLARAASPSDELSVELLADAMNEAYQYTDRDNAHPELPFVDDFEAFWTPFAAKVAAEYDALRVALEATGEGSGPAK